jgi:hypothetical protein
MVGIPNALGPPTAALDTTATAKGTSTSDRRWPHSTRRAPGARAPASRRALNDAERTVIVSVRRNRPLQTLVLRRLESAVEDEPERCSPRLPRNFLKGQGLSRGRYNQIANFVLTQSEINIAIGDRPPEIYFNERSQQCGGGKKIYGGITNPAELRANLRMSCVPETLLDGQIPAYDDFLNERRKLMALKIKTCIDPVGSPDHGLQVLDSEPTVPINLRPAVRGTGSRRPAGTMVRMSPGIFVA